VRGWTNAVRTRGKASAVSLAVAALLPSPAPAQQPAAPQQPATATSAPVSAPAPVTPAGTTPAAPAGTAAPKVPVLEVPADYTIGPDDILTVTVWREKDLSADVVVRPDGRITLPLANDVLAQGLTPDGLRERVTEALSKFVEDPSVTVVVKQINSRRVFVTGQVGKPGPYPLSAPTTVLQQLSIAGGLGEFAESKRILIMRSENGLQKAFKFNYNDVIKGKNLSQNILLKPGDTIVVP